MLRKRPFLTGSYDDDFVNWRNAKTQKSFGTEWIRIEPESALEPQPRQVCLELQSNRPFLFNNMTRFEIKVDFEKRSTAAGATEAEKKWKSVKAADADNMCLAPNWWEKLLSSIDIYHNNTPICNSDESNYVSYELSTFLYSMMDPFLKKFLAPQKCHPANGIPTKLDSWKPGGDEWKQYAAHLFAKAGPVFSYLPLFLFPFYQYPNFILDGPQAALPMHLIGKLTVRVNFRESWKNIFKVDAGCTDEFRVSLKSFALMMEEDRMNGTMSIPKSVKPSQSQIVYKGVYKESRCETIKNKEQFFRVKFQRSPMPESLLLFAIDKNVIGGNYAFSSFDATKGLFLKHNITDVIVTFDDMKLCSKSPSFQELKYPFQCHSYIYNMLAKGPFGMMVDCNKIDYDSAANEHNDGLFPHVFLSFTLDQGRERIQPVQSDGTAYKQDGSIEVSLRFNVEGATPDATYVIYFAFTDYTVIYDVRNNRFLNRYQHSSLN